MLVQANFDNSIVQIEKLESFHNLEAGGRSNKAVYTYDSQDISMQVVKIFKFFTFARGVYLGPIR